MNTITEYVLIAIANDALMLQKHVNEHIKRGYQPFGSLAVVTDNQGVLLLYQPMVKAGASN